MAKKKKAASDAVESKGVEVETAPAIVEEATILVRGKGMGSGRKMTQSEYDVHQKKCAKND
jgi:hypothetical protein